MVRKNQEQKLMSIWWVALSLATVFLAASYGFVSLAIDSGSLWHYALAILFFGYALNRIVYVIRQAFNR